VTLWGRLCLVLAVLAGAPAAAHRGHASLAVVEIDAKSGAVTVTHRLTAHDVEPALRDIAPDAQPSLDDPDALDALIAHVGRQFRIDGVVLVPAGHALAGDDIRLRYTGRLRGRPKRLRISGAVLGGVIPGHSTQVNVRRSGITRTLQFRAGDPPRAVPLPGG
jgi:hypothetical protein